MLTLGALFRCLSLAVVLSACISPVKVSTPGRALVSDATTEEVFRAVVHILSLSSEFTVISMEKDLGFISASRDRSNPVLMGKGEDIMVQCIVKETENGIISVDVTSTLSGQAMGYGMTTSAIKELFDPLRGHFPNAKLTLDDKPYVPEGT